MSSFYVIGFYFCAVACVCSGTSYGNGAILQIETVNANRGVPLNIDLSAVTSALRGQGGGILNPNRDGQINLDFGITSNGFRTQPNGGGQLNAALDAVTNALRGQGGGKQYQTVVNGQPVTIEVIRDRPNQQNQYNQMGQEYHWSHQYNQQNRYPGGMRPQQQQNVYIAKDPKYSDNPNIEVYDVYTGGNSNNNRYNNMYPYPYGQRYPNGNYPNGNFYQYSNGDSVYPYPEPHHNAHNHHHMPYPNQNRPNGNNQYPYPNQNGDHLNNNKFNQNDYNKGTEGQQNINLSDINDDNKGNMGQQNINLSELDNGDNENNGNKKDMGNHQQETKQANNNVSGYIDEFPIILLNENEIRR